MPVISMFYEIIVRMFFFDTDRHKAPHIHIQYADQKAVFSIPDGTLIEGELKPSKRKLVEAWIEIHQEELIANWNLASEGQQVFKIEPLK